ncbi:helix-turn-helix transcriptional regulator [Acidisarcina polymorpha]|nr:helix-turn-helix transcriptional regulator [Acidisarcina polymorpha]
MITNAGTINRESENLLGTYLKERRSRLDPATFDLPTARRRTPGLRREEVAQRAHVSVTWYTWLEQGRGGAPSADMLDRLARALVLEETEREHLYLLAHGRPPEVKSPVRTNGVSPRMQRVLDALESSPALIKDAAWNVVAWNEAAAAVLIDYGTLSPVERNVLRLVFCHPRLRAQLPDWEQIASFVVATFRAELARTGASQQTQALIEALSRESPEFAAMWRNHEVRKHGEGIKRVQPEVGESIALEYSSFAIDAQVGLSMVVYMPATHADAERVKALVTRRRALA